MSKPLAMTLEALLTSPVGFALTSATPLQRAICRAADGLPLGELAGCEDVPALCLKHFGCAPADVPAVPPALMVVIAGVRSGKSMIAGAAALRCALNADLSRLKHHELARVPIVAPTVDNAMSTFRLLLGAIESSPQLRALLVGKPTTDGFTIRRGDGRLVEIVVVAAHRGAVTLRSRWLAGFVLDELALFGTEPGGYAVNAEELLRAAETRLVPGGQGWLISSPFGPQGLLHALWKEHFGDPGRVLVVHAPTLAMNSISVDVATVEAIRKRDPDAAAREYDAAWTDADTALLSSLLVDAAVRKGSAELPYEPGHEYAAAMDPATRGNSWTLCIATRRWIDDECTKSRLVIVLARQWTGSKTAPLSPSAVLKEIAELCRGYHLDTAETDQFSSDALRDIADRFGLYLRIEPMTAARKLEVYETLKAKLAEGDLELPPDPVLRSDLLSVRKKVTAGGFTIDLPRTTNGRHADFAPPVAILASATMTAPDAEDVPLVHGTPAYWQAEGKRMEKAALERYQLNKESRERGDDWLVRKFGGLDRS